MKNNCYPIVDRHLESKNCGCCLYKLRTYVYTRSKRRGLEIVGKDQKSAMGKVCLLCKDCFVVGFAGQSIVAP